MRVLTTRISDLELLNPNTVTKPATTYTVWEAVLIIFIKREI